MSHLCEESYDVYDEKFPKARLPHRCDACRQTISPGHVYARVFILFDGDATTVKRCLRCQAIHKHLRILCSVHEMWPAERLDCGEEYFEHWGKPPPEDIASLAFLTDEEAQREFAEKAHSWTLEY